MNLIPLKFVLDFRSDNELVLRLGHGFRFFFVALCLFLLYFILIDDKSTSSNIGPYLIVIFSFVSSLYYEAWFFDKRSGKVIHRTGLIIAYKQTEIALNDVETFKITRFKTGDVDTGRKEKGYLVSRYIKFSLIPKTSKAHVIEVIKKSGLSDLENKAKHVARFCELPLEVEDL